MKILFYLSCLLVAETVAAAAPPNFIFILSDDQDWTGLSAQMHPNLPNSKSDFFRTPNLEKLASQGMRFSAAYAPAPVCSPTRISLQTGRNPAALGWTKAAPAEEGHRLIEGGSRKHISSEEVTVAEMLHAAGYATAHFGKWHLGGGGPEAHGYDVSDGDTGNRDADAHVDPNPVDIFGMNERAEAFMVKQAQARRPFYMQMSYYALHLPENALKSTRAFYEKQTPGRMHRDVDVAAITTDLDTGVGRLLEAVDRLGLGKNTFVIYMSDNGGGGGGGKGKVGGGRENPRPLTAGKGGVWEGGIRVPLIIRGPGVEPNSWCHQRVVGYDFFPTLCKLAGVTSALPSKLEGGDITPLLKGSDEPVKRASGGLVFHFPHYQGDTPHSAILSGRYKLIHFYETNEDLLFDLDADLAERNNLAEKQPELARQLARQLGDYLKEVRAEMPQMNSHYDPAKEPARKGGRQRQQERRKEAVKALTSSIGFAVLTLLLIAAAADKPKGGGKGGGQGGAGKGGQVEAAVVPPHLFNVWLCRPGAESVTVSVLAWEDLEAFIEYGSPTRRSEEVRLKAGEPQDVVLGGLTPDTDYHYRLHYRQAEGMPAEDAVRSFHTQRKADSTFRFVMQADSHLDNNTDVRVYEQTLANMLADRPDFMIDLGDTTMVDKFGQFFRRSESQFRAQRYYMGRIAHSVPIFMVLGNHDGERGDRAEMAEWSLGMRHKYFPNPTDGNDKHSYFAFEWGNALFVALDPFWSSRQRGEDNWSMTLGEGQYRWLGERLAKSRAAFKFVFIHHLVGGLGRDVRGGVATAPYMEWGGRNADGTEGFAEHRPGWEMPIHALLVKHGVSVVFHGHDHLYAKEELDGVVYQEVPQPGHASGGTRSAEEYGYGGVILGSSGHLRVTVGPQEAAVEYVRTGVPGVTRGEVRNGEVEHRYVLSKR